VQLPLISVIPDPDVTSPRGPRPFLVRREDAALTNVPAHASKRARLSSRVRFVGTVPRIAPPDWLKSRPLKTARA